MLASVPGSVGRCSRAVVPRFVLLARYRAASQRRPAPIWRTSGATQRRWQSGAASPAVREPDESLPPSSAPEEPISLAVPSEPRYNAIDVQQLSRHMYDQVFKVPEEQTDPPSQELVELARDHLRRHDLLGKNTDTSAPIAFDMPPLVATDTGTMDEHFFRLGMDAAEPWLSRAKAFALANEPTKPRKYVRQSGWTKYYNDGRPPEKVEAPQEDTLCVDTEVMWKEHPFAVMACAVSPEAWYVWLSPWLLKETDNHMQLIPLGDPSKERVIVGHNIGYDRARILEEYDLKQTRNSYLDTMSLHVAVNGMCSQQRPTWMKHKKNRELRDRIQKEGDSLELKQLLENSALSHDEEELWVERSSINSLRDVAKFHLNTTIDKEVRDSFGELDREGVLGKLDELLDYCAADVAVTHRIFKIIFPNFLEVCPHPVSFAALRHLSSVILPVDESWNSYIANAEATYHNLLDAVTERLISLAEKALEIKDDKEKWSNDPWLKQLDWSGQEIKMAKGKRKGDPQRPAARQKKPGKPQWYKDLFAKNDAPINITVRTRLAPILLRLSWEGYPLFWSDKYGWTFQVPSCDVPKYLQRQMTPSDMTEEKHALRDDRQHAYFKLPHKDGPTARCTNPMAKGYLAYFEKGTLSSEYPYAKEALEMNASCSYWISARDRIMSQLVVYQKDLPNSADSEKEIGSMQEQFQMDDAKMKGFILPQVIPMGTITRRAVENTWLTASNAKKNRVGSELKSMVRAPPGYVFVGADVDSEELWIASVVGDAMFKIHGGNAIGFMTLEGTKAKGTDLHSRTASILGITRNDAKVFNYGRIYGAGLKFAAQLLRQFNPGLSEKETLEIATKLYATTKGTKTNRKQLHKRPFWRGGTESFVFNKLEQFAEQDKPRTPVLGAGITEALMSRYVSKGGYLTSRINWAIQSSGVDYLHLLIVSMDYLCRRFGVDARLAITVHDEIRYLVRDHDRYRAAMALQVANLWTRAMFAQQVGIHDLPQSCAFFSAVDVDTVLRKEVDMDCLTPSNQVPIPHGESIDVAALLAKGNAARLDLGPDHHGIDNPGPQPRPEAFTYVPRVPVMQAVREASNIDEAAELRFIRAQITGDDAELRDLLKEVRSTTRTVTSVPTGSYITRALSSTSKDSKAASAKKSRATAPPRLTKSNVRPYYNQARLVPAREPILVTDALGTDRFRTGAGYERASPGAGKWSWDRVHAKHSPDKFGGSSGGGRGGRMGSSSRL